MGGFETTQRVFDHHAATGRERPASGERRARGQIAGRVGLGAGHVLCGQDYLEVGPEPGTGEHGLDLVPPRSAHKSQPEPLGGARHEVRDPGHEAERPIDQALIDSGLLGEQPLQPDRG